MIIRELRDEDNRRIEQVIRECLIEFGGNREGLAWADESMHDLFRYYNQPGRAYWVVETEEGEIAGGCGIAPFDDARGVCELQKMYLVPEARGTGAASRLLQKAFDFAREHYSQCYLETLENMHAANRFYQKNGFKQLDAPLAGSEHFACDAWYLKDLNPHAGL
ncbi:GNAT family acetyltransferase [Paenibacillus yonginensis]|uniref:GNAT family acetyltransferase n=1 Tax=Paenibacillus yonginensis TaxID=1462996 RepID=A0A1B1MYW5_9BACL|nr:GNAT family N-acetyltransferase [Paenibacillus yonginensis]ANS74361.1 GNAT family acetyltransferase [Paenibacillus yonginensis]